MKNCGIHPKVPHGATGLTDSRETLKEMFTWQALKMGHKHVSYNVCDRKKRRDGDLTFSLNTA